LLAIPAVALLTTRELLATPSLAADAVRPRRSRVRPAPIDDVFLVVLAEDGRHFLCVLFLR
jgi:hypothetical protein